MIDIERAVYTAVADKFTEAYPEGSHYGEPVEVPASFPCMTLEETDNNAYMKTLDAEPMEHHANLVYELNIYSNLQEGAKCQCREILSALDGKMQELGFYRTFCRQTRNQDERIFRMTARYRGVVSEEHRIYRR